MAAAERVFRPGTWYRYALASEQSVIVHAEQADAELPPPMRFQLKGEWRVGVCAASAEGVDTRIVFSPSDTAVEVGGAPLIPEAHRDLRNALSIPFFVTLDGSGRVRSIHFEHAVDALAQGLLRSVVASSQVVFPSTKRASWEASEEDSSGRYVASYQSKPPLGVDKRKLRYSDLVLDEGVQPVDADFKVKVDARSTLTLAPEDLWLESLQDEETVTMVPGADMPIAGGHTRVELRLLERGSDPSLEEAFAARRPALLSQPLASPLRDSPQDPNDPYRQVLAGRTLSDFARLLRELPEEQKARDDALSQALTGLQALFVVEPASAAKVSGLLRSGLSHDAVSTIHGALSGVQTREALRALSQIMDDSQLAPEVREDAAEAMNLVEAPTEENIAVLWRLAWGSNAALCQTAILALGTSAMHLQKQDARAAEAMVDEMSRALGAAHGEEAQNVWLGALGNTRSPRALPVVKPFLIVSSVAIRSTATLSLRFMPAPEADRLLSERLLSDDAVKVRSAAVFAASYRPLAPLLPTFERALRADREPVVRKDLVHLLGAQVDSSPEARSLLTWSSQKDPDASVRDGAAKVLARPPLRKGAARSVDDGSRRPGGAAFNAPSNELTELGASK